jgi:hypothetical protein
LAAGRPAQLGCPATIRPGMIFVLAYRVKVKKYLELL